MTIKPIPGADQPLTLDAIRERDRWADQVPAEGGITSAQRAMDRRWLLAEVDRLRAIEASFVAVHSHRVGDASPETAAPCGEPDASLEARAQLAWRDEWQRMAGDIRAMSGAGKSPTDILAILLTHIDMMPPLAVDASRPTLTEEQIETLIFTLRARPPFEGDGDLLRALRAMKGDARRASRGETGPAADQVAPLPDSWRCEECKETFARCACKHGDPEHSRNLGPGIGGAPIRVRPIGLTSIMADAQQRPSVPPASAFGEWPEPERSGLTCPGCYAATGIATPCAVPPDPRATLHAGDPASLAEVVAASAREPHADVVLHALHVSGGAAAVASLDEKHVLVTSRVDGVTRTTVDGEHVPLRRAAGPKCNNCDDTGTCGACNAEPVDPPCVLCSLGDCLCGERRGNREP